MYSLLNLKYTTITCSCDMIVKFMRNKSPNLIYTKEILTSDVRRYEWIFVTMKQFIKRHWSLYQINIKFSISGRPAHVRWGYYFKKMKCKHNNQIIVLINIFMIKYFWIFFFHSQITHDNFLVFLKLSLFT